MSRRFQINLLLEVIKVRHKICIFANQVVGAAPGFCGLNYGVNIKGDNVADYNPG